MVDLVMVVEEHFGIALRNEEAQRIRTIGDLTDAVYARMVSGSDQECLAMRAFFEVRELIRRGLGDHSLRMRPSTRLDVLLPVSVRKQCWEVIEQHQTIGFPSLRLSNQRRSEIAVVMIIALVSSFVCFPKEIRPISIPAGISISLAVIVIYQRFRTEIPRGFVTVADLVRSYAPTMMSTKKKGLTTKAQVFDELLPIVSEQLGVDLSKLRPETRFVEDLGAD